MNLITIFYAQFLLSTINSAPSLNYPDSKPIVVEQIKTQFQNYKIKVLEDDSQMYKVEISSQSNELLATISYTETKSALRPGKLLGKLIIEGKHY